MAYHTFQTEDGPELFEVFYDPAHPFGPGWFWWPSSVQVENYGPFKTEEDAFQDAQDFAEGGGN